MANQLVSAPASAIIDNNNLLTLSWQPPICPDGFFDQYQGWDIQTKAGLGSPITVNFLAPVGYTGTALTYTQNLTANDYTMSMTPKANAIGSPTASDGNPWQTSGVNTFRSFPQQLLAADIQFSATTLLLGQPLTVTLNPAYAGADQWQIIWPDTSTTGWLPLTAAVVVKTFSIPGAQNIVVQTRRNYSSNLYSPITTLIRQFTQQIFVTNQQAPTSSSNQGGLTGDLGIGGQQGFEIVDASSSGVTPQPFEVIARALVRDTVTNELKLLVASSRFSNASSLFGTMAIDVFPIEGRPKDKEVILPPYELIFSTDPTESVPVKIGTTVLPNLFVGKSVETSIGGVLQMQVKANTGIAPFIWSATGFPAGLSMNSSGVINGVPLELGLFTVNFAVSDGSTPPSVDQVSLQLLIETDLLVKIAPAQTDALGVTLTTTGTSLGTARVGTPYKVQMAVGNINNSASAPGGLPPYTWSTPAGALPVGLTIDPASGVISGVPATYNSTVDFTHTYTVTVQVTDSINAKATNTYTMSLVPAALSLGPLDQPVIYAGQDFKLVVPVFGGTSPYVFNSGTDFQVPSVDLTPLQLTLSSVGNATGGQSVYVGTVTNGDNGAFIGRTFVITGFTNSANNGTFLCTGSSATTLTLNNANGVTEVHAGLATAPLYYSEILVDGQIQIIVNMPTTNAGVHTFSLSIRDSGLNSITPVTQQFTYRVEQEISDVRLVPALISHVWNAGDASEATPLPITGNLSGFSLAGFRIDFSAVANAVSGATLYTSTGTIPNGAANGLVNEVFQVSGFFNPANNGTYTCTASTSSNITLNNANGVAEPLVFTLTAAANASAAHTVYTGTITGGASNAYAGQTFTITGFTNGLNNGTFLCSASSGTNLTLANAAGVAETHAATATMVITPKALLAVQLSNGITVGVDPTIPDVEFFGPPGPTFRNSEYYVPLSLQQGGNTIASVSRAYTTLAHNGAAPPADYGAVSSFARAYIIGDIVGLNPRSPYFNSSNLPALTSYTNVVTARVQNGSALPAGLSLDANTGLIYGPMSGTFNNTSVIEYVDTNGVVHSTVTINWTIFQPTFAVVDNIVDGVFQVGTLQPPTPVNGNNITAPANTTLSGAAIVSGQLPKGMVFSYPGTGQDAVISGTPSEAGYFDCWFSLQGPNNSVGYAYHRIVSQFLKPLTITNTALPTISAQPYTTALIGFGGIPPYITPNGGWSASDTAGAWVSGVPPVGSNFVGLTLTSNPDGTATLAGTLSSPPVTSPTDLGNITFTLADQRGTSSQVTAVLDLSYDNRLRITTTQIPIITNDPNGYSFAMSAAGGVPPYQWELQSPGTSSPGAHSVNLPDGITFDAVNSFGTTGTFSGIWSGTWTGAAGDTQAAFNIVLRDSFPTTLSPQAFTIKTGVATLFIDSSLVGPIPRGESYLGTLAIVGTYTTPVSWQVAPTVAFPNTLLTGLTLAANLSNLGQTALISGTYSGVPHTVQGPYTIDHIQQTTTTVTLTIGAGHQMQVGDTVVVAGLTLFPYMNGTWRITAVNNAFPVASTTFSYSVPIGDSGTVALTADSGTANGQSYKIRVIAVDNVANVAGAVITLVTNTNLKIVGWNTAPATTQQSFPLPNATVGGSYPGPPATAVQLVATGGASGGYTWSSSPAFPFDGIALATTGVNAGQLSGSATIAFSQPFNFTVTDSIFNTFTLNSVILTAQASGLNITTSSITNVTSGRAFTFTLTAAGSAFTPYTFSISPLSGANQLPTGLSISSAGVISGTTTVTGFSKPITFRVQDTSGAYSDKALTVNVIAGLTLKTGIDFTDSTSTGILGYAVNGSVDSINPRPNLSFYVIAQGVVSTNTSQIQVNVGTTGVTSNITSLSGGVAKIQLSGAAFPNAPVGTSQLQISVTDSGVTANGTFSWIVYDDGQLRLAPSSGSIPTQLLTPS